MDTEEKTAWIDEEKRIVSFHAIENSRMVRKSESLFWNLIESLARSGYRIM